MKSYPPVSALHTRGVDTLDVACVEQFLAQHPEIKKAKTAIIVPAYNEALSIGAVLDSLPSDILGQAPVVIVVSDGSTDETAKVSRDHGALVAEVPVNRGQGSALKLGYQIAWEAGTQYVGVVDADGQWDPSDLLTAVTLLSEGSADFAQGSRVLGSTQSTDAMRNLGVKVFALIISRLIGQTVTDTSSGIRALRTELFAKIRLEQPQYQASELLLSAALGGARIVEFPVAMAQRTAGSSKKARNALYGLYFFLAMTRTWLRDRWISPL